LYSTKTRSIMQWHL